MKQQTRYIFKQNKVSSDKLLQSWNLENIENDFGVWGLLTFVLNI